MTLSLRVVERWKGKRKVMVGNSGEKWEIGDDVTQHERSNNKCYGSVFRYIKI